MDCLLSFWEIVMRVLFDPIRAHIAKAIESVLPTNIEPRLTLVQIHDALVAPPNTNLGELAFGCFQLAKAAKTSPQKIAADLAELVLSDPLIDKSIAAGPYLNFQLKPEGMGALLFSRVQNGEALSKQFFLNSQKTMIEYSQPNTHKELHVGHMRNACLGDALIRILRATGVEVVSSTFPGDQGTHVAKCLWYMKNKNHEPVPSIQKGEWLGQMYTKGHLLLEDQLGSVNEEQNRKELTDILKQLEEKKGPYFELWQETREWSFELMQSVYSWLGIKFDQWYWESDVDQASIAYVKVLFEEGKLVRSEGAIGMDLSDVNLGFCLLLKTDGTGLYATKDLELAKRKFQDFDIEKSIYVVDQRQALHFQQIFAVLKRLGFSRAEDCFHLQYNFVELPDGAMSSRKGNIVPLSSLIENMQKMVKEQYLARYRGEWSDAEIDLVASQVAKGAIKYGMVKIDNNKKIVFDMQEWLKLDGDSGPFIQYSAARISSLINKLGPVDKNCNWSLLQHSSEKALMAHLLNFSYVVAHAAETYRPSILCTYLLETAKKFNHFYHECSIGQAETSSLKNARLALAQVTSETLKSGLELIGIPAPTRM